MIQNLLDANRIQVGEKIPLKIESVDLNVLIYETLDNFAPLFGDRFDFHSSDRIQGYWSASGLMRILENLLNNAIKYGDPHGRITVEASVRESTLELSVHNVGNPMSAEDIESIFTPYKRSKSADRGAERGWGLGLTLVRGVSEAMGGSVDVKSDEKMGTVFRITLPVDSREAYGV